MIPCRKTMNGPDGTPPFRLDKGTDATTKPDVDVDVDDTPEEEAPRDGRRTGTTRNRSGR